VRASGSLRASLVGALTFAAACAAPTATTAPVVSEPAPATAAAEVPDADPSTGQTDAEITEAVSIRLRDDPSVRLHALAVQTDEGVVTLRGNVDSVGERNVAVYLAGEAFGVLGVVPDLVIEPAPTAPSD
jgi:osmotically-inducible protein OsmY